MKKLFTTIMMCLSAVCMMAQGWPANYGGVMLQGFYWDYYDDPDWGTWEKLANQADDLEGYIDLIWVPNSARTKNDYCVEHAATDGNGWLKDMGYMPCWWLNHDNTIFGNTAELKSMIATYKAKGIGIIEDVVINHKNGQNDWCDFPNEEVIVGGKNYTLNWSLADICYNDNGGYVRTMFDVTGAGDTGDDFDGCRDLDHTGANVQKNVKTYLDYLQKELGYAGFRYDMVKGYGPQYVGIYNAYAKPTFSVGEFWDNWDGTTRWVNGTKQNGVVQSAAFDFPLKFKINEAFGGNNFDQEKLSWLAMAGDDFYKRYSVTFVDNHDTYRDATKMGNEHHVLAANAFILSMPGTPCIFLPHWKTHKDALKRMIAARKAAGITNQSSFESYVCNNGNGRSFLVHGSEGDILLLLGDCGYTPSEEDYCSVWNGDVNNWNFRMFVSKSLENALGSRPSASNANLGTARVDKASGTYYPSVTVNVSPSDPFTTLVYTQDGSDPTTSSSTIPAGGQSFTYEEAGTYTLKVGVNNGTSVINIQTYRYVVTDEEPTDITIYVRADKNPIYLYAWDNNGTLTADWPGTQLSAMKSANGQNFYYMTFPKPSADYTLNYILNQGSDATKTADNTGVGSDIFTALGDANQPAQNLTGTYTGATIADPVEATEPITVYVKGDFGPAYLYTWNGYSTGAWPGTKMSTTVINGETWFYYTMPKTVTSFNMIVNQGEGQPQSNNYEGVISTVYLKYNGGGNDLTTVGGMAEYPILPWYEQGEVCAFFVIPNGWTDNWQEIHAYAYNNDGIEYTTSWRGDACTFLGYNENGDQIWKWTCLQNVTGLPTKIIFNSKIYNEGLGENNKTEDLTFVNGAWYSAESYKNSGKTDPISTAVAPSNEITLANLGGTVTTATNWNGKREKVAENNGNNPMSKNFLLTAGEEATSYVVQAIVRGTADKTLTLSAKGQDVSVGLAGLDNAPSTVQTNGIVEKYSTDTNNGWQKVELSFTLAAGTTEKVTVELTSTANQWQVGALKVLTGTTAKTKATTGVDLANAYIDVRGESGFSFYERGENRNALIKANANTLPAQLPYNVIVDDNCTKLQLTDGDYSFKNAGEAFTAASVSYDRNFPTGRSTICLPFALTAAEAAAAGTFWALDSYNASTGDIHFIKVEATEANTPYIFEARTTQPFLMLSPKAVPTSSLVTVTKDGISFIGVNERKHLVSEENGTTTTYYGYQGEYFVKVGTSNGAYINPFRAYLQTDVPMPARMSVSFDGDVMGIQDITPTMKPMMQQPIYNLGGQRVKTPNKKGLYIMGGKKYLVR